MKSKLVTYLSNLNPVKVILLSLVAIVFGIVYGYVVFPMILKFVMKTVSLYEQNGGTII